MERDDAWVRAQKELEEERRKKAEAGQQTDGKSLFEVLQQNKSELEPLLCFSFPGSPRGIVGGGARKGHSRLRLRVLVYSTEEDYAIG